ncbi:hypothetical protein DFQ28_009704 [Apophysomyces sp. BC1034]|nr:hypothetical protein DFQ30_009396 [Apophysomyces sp. BC1015]KAG0169429.1 hypothetical protein DFQ29_009687 [Apophysomyces sp. BC1021]KAG0185214.1 hypothetical protein DFQ28_009704 [Apophysomyces sp. BC1034]
MTFRSKASLLSPAVFSEENDNIVNIETSWHRSKGIKGDPSEQSTIRGAISTLHEPAPTSHHNQDDIFDPNEKYITFFTHSGFQNQLIQVENGILLAWYLNRTLILPKALMGEAFGWSYFGKLHLEHMLRDDAISDTCTEFESEIFFWKIQCPDRQRYAMLPFDEIFDLSWAKRHVKIVLREQANFNWLESKFGIRRAGVPDRGNGSYVDGDILFFKGETRYDWRIFDTPPKSHRLGKYGAALDIYQLRKRPEKLIHFSSLFGTGKLPIRRPEHWKFHYTLQLSITYRHPAVLSMTEKIIQRLGGEGNFIGLHVRASDGWFVKALSENINSIVSQITRAVDSRLSSVDSILSPPPEIPLNPTLDQCLELSKQHKVTLIYMATDARLPRSDPAFDPLWNFYPCTFTIDDIVGQDKEEWAELDEYADKRTGMSLRKFLIPLVDASTASRGWFFIGSDGSTFSGYISRLHDIFQSKMKEQSMGLES